MAMDKRLQAALLQGDLPALLQLVGENEGILDQTVPLSLKTALHIVSRCGHKELVAEIINLRPEMVSIENERMETPLHEACMEGHVEVCIMLLKALPWVAYNHNRDRESVLLVACRRGHLKVVKYLLKESPLLLLSEDDGSSTSLHAAVSGGFSDIVREILKIRPYFARKKDGQGLSPLHIAASKGNLEITRELLRIDCDLCFLKDNYGRSPLHAAAAKGRVTILEEILSTSLESASMVTNQGETILHLSVKNNQYDALRYLVEKLDITHLINLQDNGGNTVLHLATAGKFSTMVRYLLSNTGVNINIINNSGIKAPLECGDQEGNEQPLPESFNIKTAVATSPLPRLPTNIQTTLKRHEIHCEGLRNARNTITMVALLIATVTFAAGICPPGGVNQVNGKSVAGRTVPFKVFTVSNHMALFLSLGIVVVQVSVIPVRRKSMMMLLTVTHKVLWVAVSFMTVAYIAAMWVILPRGRGSMSVLVVGLSIGAGVVGSLFVGLVMMLVRHWLMKSKWKKEKGRRKKVSPKSHVEEELSSNSDVESYETSGYHIY